MKQLLFAILMITVLAGCAGKDGSNGSNGANGDTVYGPPGTPGSNGSNSHSIVAKSRSATVTECPVTVGSAVDFYMDLDDSGFYSVGDSLQAGVVSCNGTNGTNGVNGSNGVNGTNGTNGTNGAPGSSATMTVYSLAAANSCVSIHTGIYAKRWDNNTASLFSDSGCLSQIDVGEYVLNSAINEMYVTAGNVMLLLEGTSTSMVLRKLVWSF